MIRQWAIVLAVAVGVSTPPLHAQTPVRVAEAAVTHKIAIKSFKFDPEKIDVRVGDTIEWTNLDLAPHTATADATGGWTTEVIKNAGTGTYVVTEPGTLPYHCRFHPQMKGTIIATARTGDAG